MIQNPVQMIQKYNEFKANITGDPKEEVQKLLNSGRMSQNQYNSLQAMAMQFQKMINR